MCDALFDELFKTTGEKTDEIIMKNWCDFSEFLNKNPETQKIIRVFADTPSPGTGHINATCTLIRRIALPCVFKTDTVPGLGYTGLIQIICDNPKDDRFSLFLPELASGKLYDAKLDIADIKSLTDTVMLGFTGGGDKGKTPLSKMKVRYFLRLQPLHWSLEDQIEFLVPDKPDVCINLSSSSDDEIYPFFDRGFYEPTPVKPEWKQWIAKTSGEMQKHILNMEAVMEQALPSTALPPFLFMPWYPFNKDFAGSIKSWVVNLIGGIMVSQFFYEKEHGSRPTPVVILCTDDKAVDCNMPPLSEALDILKGISPKPMLPFQAFKPLVAAHYFVEILGKEDSIDFYTPDDLAGLTAHLKVFLDGYRAGSPKRILFIKIGWIPPQVFAYVMSQRTFPCFIEGANAASLAVTHGKPYLHLCVQGRGPVYPNIPVKSGLDIRNLMLGIKSAIHVAPNKWGEGDNPANPAEIVSDFFMNIWENTPLYQDICAYFAEVGKLYGHPMKDKFAFAVAYLFNILSGTKPAAAGYISGKESRLEELYQILKSRIVMGMPANILDFGLLPGAFPDNLCRLLTLSEKNLILTPDVLEYHEKGTLEQPYIQLGGTIEHPVFRDVKGICRIDALFFERCGYIEGEFTFKVSSEEASWSLPGLPWIVLKKPYIVIKTAEILSYPADSYAGGTWSPQEEQGFEVRFTVTPGQDVSVWAINAHLEKPYPSIEYFYGLTGGANLFSLLPKPLQVITNLGLSHLSAVYDSNTMTLHNIGFILSSNQQIPLFSNLSLADLSISASLESVMDVSSRHLSGSVSGTFSLGAGEDAGLVRLDAAIPDVLFSGSLVSGKVTFHSLWELFLPFLPNPFGSNAGISSLSFSFDPASSYFTGEIGLELSLKLLGLFQLEGICVYICHDSRETTGCFSADTVLFPENRMPLSFTLTADYQGNGQGWVYTGKQTKGSIRIGTLLSSYLAPSWAPPEEYNYGIKNICVGIAPSQDTYSFQADTEGVWVLPFIPKISVSDAEVSVSKTPKGNFGEISGNLDLFGISLFVFYDFHPDIQQFGITWKSLTALVTKFDEHHWKASVSLVNQTLGGMIETFIGWISGSSFGLTPPWDVLDSCRLDTFALGFDFFPGTDKQCEVSFSVKIGPIDLGIAKITDVSLSYIPKGPDKGLNLSLIGKFAWDDPAIKKLPDGTSALGWDPSKPETAPAPPGKGNKYLDLRLLALGQHIRINNAETYRTVSQVIDSLKEISAPQGEELPLDKPHMPSFASENAWLIAADFGVLRFSEEGGKSGYFLNLSAVFNDPALYALRVSLDGPAAKVLKGLDFEIMYRQVTDKIGCYSAQLSLPDKMRTFQAGVFSVTMPKFGIELYTNGDFTVDAGFPWNQDFTRSFTLEAVVAPGIPVTGSAGFYFGKLSSATTDQVPRAVNGTFNPVIVFGFGVRFGVGKSLDAGILTAGFSITAFGILTGVIARWHPYDEKQLPDATTQIQDSYYFSLTGIFGVTGELYGTIDFAIIKASLNVKIQISVSIAYASYQPIPITVMAMVEVRLSLKLNLGLFSISIGLSFSLHVKETFEIKMQGNAPWHLSADALLSTRKQKSRLYKDVLTYRPCWDNLESARIRTLDGLLIPAVSACGDTSLPLSAQYACYIPLFFLKTAPPVHGNMIQVQKKLQAKQRLEQESNTEEDSFESLVFQTARWILAAGIGKMDEDACDNLVVSEAYLESVLTYFSDEDMPIHVAPADIREFLTKQFILEFSLPQWEGQADGVLFPAVPDLCLDVPSYNGYPALHYTFAEYNSVTEEYLQFLSGYFAQLAVSVEEETKESVHKTSENTSKLSVASYVFSDYFSMIARQIIKSMLDGLRNYVLFPKAGASIRSVLDEINHTGSLPGQGYETFDFMDANGEHILQEGCVLTLPDGTHTIKQGETLRTIADSHKITLRDLSSLPQNLEICGLFDLESDPSLNVPHLPQYQVKALLEESARTLGIQRLGSMLSRYGLHGLRLPTDGVTFQNGSLPLPKEMGLYALMGQQFPIPPIKDGVTFSFTLTDTGKTSFVRFKGSQNNSAAFYLNDPADLLRVKAIQNYVTTQILPTDILAADNTQAFSQSPVSYSLVSRIPWQAEGSPHLSIFPLPDEMISRAFGGGQRYRPRFAPKKSRFDEASGLIAETPIKAYRFGTQVSFTIRKSTLSDSSPSSLYTYEILGAGDKDAHVLESLLGICREEKELIDSIRILYAAENGKNGGLVCDRDENVVLGIVQANLSTVTHPDSSLSVENIASGSPMLLNDAAEFIRLLWEASVTRFGGFFLSYCLREERCGLPDRIFNDRQEAVLSLLVLQNTPSPESQERIWPCTNILTADTVFDNNEGLSAAAVSENINHVFSAGETLAGIAASYLGSIAALARQNSRCRLSSRAVLTAQGGIYQVLPGQDPGGEPSRIAKWFEINIDALKKANPGLLPFPDVFPPFTALHLPEIAFTARSGRENCTLEEAARRYGIPLEKLADINAHVPDIFEPGTILAVAAGPFTTAPLTRPLTAGETLCRQVPDPDIPPAENPEKFAEEYLKKQFHLLGYSIIGNEDFIESTDGIPAGPTDTGDKPAGLSKGKFRSPHPLKAGEEWNYRIMLSYASFIRDGNPAPNRYSGTGRLLLLGLTWHDLFGNRILTDFDSTAAALSRLPQKPGYSDSLIGPNQWPSVSADYLVGRENTGSCIYLTFTLDASRYLPGDVNEEPAAKTQNARAALITFRTIYEQLTDPNGVSIRFTSSLTPQKENLIDKASRAAIVQWVMDICRFLEKCRNKETPAAIPPLYLSFPVSIEELNQKDFFELETDFCLMRNPLLAAPGLAHVNGILENHTPVTAYTENSGSGGTKGLETFAAKFTQALSSDITGKLVIAAGSSAGSSAVQSLFAVRIGNGKKNGIFCRPLSSEPILFAPKPLCRDLQSRTHVPLFPYETGKGISYDMPYKYQDYANIDLNVWLRGCLFTLDKLLLPQYLTAIKFVDRKTGNSLQQGLLDCKTAIAAALKKSAVPVYADTIADEKETQAVQEAYYQLLLSSLENAFTLDLLGLLPAEVSSALGESGLIEESPRLFGELQGKCDISFTSPKLSLAAAGADNPAYLTFGVTAPEAVKSVHASVQVSLDYNASFIEHEISTVPGTDGYQSSSWLHFVNIPDEEFHGISMNLGTFSLPFVLRQYPEIPSVLTQTAAAAKCPQAGQKLADSRQWDYSFAYHTHTHRMQDTIYALVLFNRKMSAMEAYSDRRSLFDYMAQLQETLPQIQTDLDICVRQINSPEIPDAICNTMSAALKSLIEMYKNLAESLDMAYTAVSDGKAAKNPAELTIREQNVQGIFETVVAAEANFPDNLCIPNIELDGLISEKQPSPRGSCICRYIKEAGGYLTTEEALLMEDRLLLFPNLDIIRQQDAVTSLHLTRNEYLTEGRRTAEDFIFKTPDVSFTNPIMPCLVHDSPLNLAKIGASGSAPQARTLKEHLACLLQTLLCEDTPPLQIQVTIDYAYQQNALAATLSSIPVLMMPPASLSAKDNIAEKLASECTKWFENVQPNTNGAMYHMELILLSQLTSQPMPVLRFTDLYVELAWVLDDLQ